MTEKCIIYFLFQITYIFDTASKNRFYMVFVLCTPDLDHEFSIEVAVVVGPWFLNDVVSHLNL